MKSKSSVLAIAGTVCAVALFAHLNSEAPSSTSLFMQDHPLENEFAKFTSQYGRSFGTKAEFTLRRDLFAKKHAELEKMKKQGFNVEVNDFADWTEQELSKLFGYTPRKNYRRHSHKEEEVETYEAGDPIDWRDLGAVNPVKD